MADDLVTIRSFDFLPQAQVAKLHLEEAGIAAFIADAETVTMDWFLGNAVGFIKLQVPRSVAEQAIAILAEGLPKDNESASRSTTDSLTCLVCGAKMPEDQEKCPSCGWTYRETAGAE